MSVEYGFLMEPVTLSFDRLLPSRKLLPSQKRSSKYRQILSSLQAVGLIEPLVVSKADRQSRHILLDGHVRLEALHDLGHTEAACLVATDDEAIPTTIASTAYPLSRNITCCAAPWTGACPRSVWQKH